MKGRSALSIALAMLAVMPVGVLAQERAPDNLYVSGELDSGAVSGGGGEVQWVQSLTDRTSVVLGGASTSISGQWWTYGRIGAFTKRRYVSLVGTTDLGGGASLGGNFPYSRYAVSGAVPLPHKLYAEGEAQYVLATHTGTRVVKAGAAFVGLRRTTLRAALFRSSTGSAEWKYVSGRADVDLGRLGLAGGLTTGTGAMPPGFSVVQLLAHTSQEVFGAVTIDSHRAKTIWSLETIRQPSGRIARMLVTLNLPIGPRPERASEVHDDSTERP
jgi:hypothetical protein